MGPRRFVPLLFVLALFVVACSSSGATGSPSASSAGAVCASASDISRAPGWGQPSSPPSVVPVIVSNDITCGKARIVFLFLDKANKDVSGPDRTAKVTFYDLARDPNTVVATPTAPQWEEPPTHAVGALPVIGQ